MKRDLTEWRLKQLTRLAAVVLVFAASLPVDVRAQSASSLSNVAGAEEDVRAEVAANNPWLASFQVAHKFAGSGDFSDNMFVAGNVIYEIFLDSIASRKWRLPIISNFASLSADASNAQSGDDSSDVASSALLSSAQGVHIRVAPYRAWNRTNTRLTVFTGIGAKVNTLAARDSTLGDQELLQGRISAGLEIAIGKKADDAYRPLTVAVSGIGSFFSESAYEKIFGVADKGSMFSLEMTAIVPIKEGAGVLAEAVVARDFRPAIRLGFLVAKK